MKRANVLLTIVAIPAVLLAGYVLAYFVVRQEARLSPTGVGYIMMFRNERHAKLFWPVMRAQGLLTGYGIFYMTEDGKADCVCQDRF